MTSHVRVERLSPVMRVLLEAIEKNPIELGRLTEVYPRHVLQRLKALRYISERLPGKPIARTRLGTFYKGAVRVSITPAGRRRLRWEREQDA